MDWHPASLFQRGKKGNWYAEMTVPAEARAAFGNKQVRLSTGTSDRRLAERKLHDLEAKMREKVLASHQQSRIWQPDSPYRKAVELLGIEQQPYSSEYQPEIDDVEPIPLSTPPQTDGERQDAFEKISAFAFNLLAKRARHELDPEVAGVALRNGGFPPSEDDVHGLLADVAKILRIDGQSSSECLSQLLGRFKAHLAQRVEAGNLKLRTSKDWPKYVIQFLDYVGDLPINAIEAKHGYSFAQELADQGYNNSTIKSRITAVSGMLHFAETKGLIGTNPLHGLKLSTYGVRKENYRPLSDRQLTALFAIPNLPQELKYLWAILIATGMRLEEAALLHTDQVNLEDVPYFDLRSAKVKNKGSARRVPIPEVILPLAIHLKNNPRSNDGRVFSFSMKTDGKSRASELSSHWRKKVKLEVMAPRGPGRFTLHSMRGSLKDKLRDAEVSDGLNDAILGHGQHTVSASYGDGPSLKRMQEALNKVSHPYLEWIKEMTL
ncbi:hypothetical protein LSUCC0031_05515 [Rhodobacterales bacterium LSUCC0031]|nr:hypothetical protein [Rhodobacterales bacterium LSUCC0031]